MNGINRITAVFQNRNDAERAVEELRGLGVTNEHVSVVARHEDNAGLTGGVATTGGTGAIGTHDAHDADDGRKGVLAGAGVGALLGLGAALIPGVGPFISAGVLSTTLAGAAAGSVVGGVSGSLSDRLESSGYGGDEAREYGRRVEQGGVLVAVEGSGGVSGDRVRDVLTRNGGYIHGGGSLGLSGSTVSNAGYSDLDARYPTADAASTRLRDIDDRLGASSLQERERLQLLEERLIVEKHRERLGSVEVSKHVETRQEQVSIPISHEEIVIERRPVTGERPVEGSISLGAAGETIRVDLEAERANVQKQAYVTEEVEVSKRTETETRTFTETVGREVLDVNRTGDVDIDTDDRDRRR